MTPSKGMRAVRMRQRWRDVRGSFAKITGRRSRTVGSPAVRENPAPTKTAAVPRQSESMRSCATSWIGFVIARVYDGRVRLPILAWDTIMRALIRWAYANSNRGVFPLSCGTRAAEVPPRRQNGFRRILDNISATRSRWARMDCEDAAASRVFLLREIVRATLPRRILRQSESLSAILISQCPRAPTTPKSPIGRLSSTPSRDARCILNRGAPLRSPRCRSFSSASSHRTLAWRRGPDR
jgi:hypothetical protein